MSLGLNDLNVVVFDIYRLQYQQWFSMWLLHFCIETWSLSLINEATWRRPSGRQIHKLWTVFLRRCENILPYACVTRSLRIWSWCLICCHPIFMAQSSQRFGGWFWWIASRKLGSMHLYFDPHLFYCHWVFLFHKCIESLPLNVTIKCAQLLNNKWYQYDS